MPNRTRKNSVADLLAKVPVQRGSLIGAIENLLKTIDCSESAVMIPTLLRDKCEFDAWELLFVAKILRASILGHIDLVEFYMNHIGLNMSHTNSSQQQFQTAAGHEHTRQSATCLAHSPAKHPQTNHHTTTSPLDPSSNGLSSAMVPQAPASPSLSSADTTSSLSSLTANTSASGASSAAGSTSTSTDPTTIDSISPISANNNNNDRDRDLKECAHLPFSSLSPSINNNNNNTNKLINNRVPQPPTLLHLTTNNNHINAITNTGCLDSSCCSLPAEPLSISTGNSQASTNTGASQHSSQIIPSQQEVTAAKLAAEFEHMSVNRSVSSSTTTNFLAALRPNSGASSPRTSTAQTPATPCPQAETLASGAQSKLAGDASAPVKLLLQIEQLKSSIVNVTSLLESVVELYKKSIDSIALP